MVKRDLADAALPDLSDDRRFATAYNAALQLTKMVLACAGYRVTRIAHHQTSFEALPLVMGEPGNDWSAYFDVCRRKRNALDYDLAPVTTETDARELLQAARTFRDDVEAWIAEQYPSIAVGADMAR